MSYKCQGAQSLKASNQKYIIRDARGARGAVHARGLRRNKHVEECYQPSSTQQSTT
ncbi:12286_t:CDS:2 [Funneliformis geosporum]|uniref:9310_t:CDS:1 n=1 Tax=Funneliformis geosporum TaxID=1117311 RepID=A0A9W4STC8_9GLOM|nr:9310_t:CDS:2 [Funneliformis geosporum]CAI2191146.1 12286_t:CDS:2 [Funneliformis geosporum]